MKIEFNLLTMNIIYMKLLKIVTILMICEFLVNNGSIRMHCFFVFFSLQLAETIGKNVEMDSDSEKQYEVENIVGHTFRGKKIYIFSYSLERF